MSTITTIQSSDQPKNSRAVINTNFSNLNTDKMEKSSNLSDVANKVTAQNNLLPTQATYGGKVLGTDGSNVSWVDPSGAAKATQSVQGITALSVAATDPLLPKAVGDNDPRMPTQAMRDAMAGTGTPSSSNKFVTKDTDDLKELLSNKDTSTSLGTSDSKYPSQNAVKTYVDGWGIWKKISTITINQSTVQNTPTKIAEWTSLTGDSDDNYLIEWEFVADDTMGTTSYLSLKINDDNGANHYAWNNFTNTTGTTVAASGVTADNLGIRILIGSSVINFKNPFGSIQIKATKTIGGVVRMTMSDSVGVVETGSSGLNRQIGSGTWTDTTNQITSLQLYLYQNEGTRVITGKATLYKINR